MIQQFRLALDVRGLCHDLDWHAHDDHPRGTSLVTIDIVAMCSSCQIFTFGAIVAAESITIRSEISGP